MAIPAEFVSISSLKRFASQTLRPAFRGKKRGFSAWFRPGGAVPPPRVLPFATAKRSGKREPACKPGSVMPWSHEATIPLGVRLPAPSSNLPGRIGRASLLPYLVLLQTGYAEHAASPRHLVGSYPTVSPLPPKGGGLLSVALSEGHPSWGLPSVLPCGARTFLPESLRGGGPADSRLSDMVMTAAGCRHLSRHRSRHARHTASRWINCSNPPASWAFRGCPASPGNRNARSRR